jgi:hypothetical protein
MISVATKLEANDQEQVKLTREFYQQRGLFCIDVTWGTTILKTVYLNIFNSTNRVWKQYSKLENSIKTRFSKQFDHAGIHTVIFENYRSSEIITIKNCSNTCKASLLFKNCIENFLIPNQMEIFKWYMGKKDLSSLDANY